MAKITDAIDFDAAVRATDLAALISADQGQPNRAGKWRCAVHDDHDPSMSLIADGRRWKCWSCDASGDAIDWLVRVHGYSNVDAARSLLGLPGSGRARVTPKRAESRTPKPEPKAVWRGEVWQVAVREVVEAAEAALWSRSDPGAAAVRAWLAGRGLTDRSLRQFRVGYLPAERWVGPIERRDGTIGRVRLGRGATFPWAAPGSDYDRAHDGGPPRFCGLNVRHLNADPGEPWVGSDKMAAITGSERGHLYPWPTILPSQGPIPALVAEGEVDSLLAVQEAGHLVFAGTVGGAQTGPRPSALAILESCPSVLIASDRDRAGAEAAWAWRERLPGKTRRVLVPGAKDLGDFVVGGGDLAGWLKGELARLELDRPLAPPAVDPAVRFDAIRARMLGTSLGPDHRAEDLAYAQTERFEHRLADGIPGGDPNWWPMVASWPLDRQQEWSSVASGLIREARAEGRSLNAAEAERLAAEQLATIPF